MNDHNDFIKELYVFIQKQKLNFKNKTDEELINTFNSHAGLRNWGHFISHYIKIMAKPMQTQCACTFNFPFIWQSSVEKNIS